MPHGSHSNAHKLVYQIIQYLYPSMHCRPGYDMKSFSPNVTLSLLSVTQSFIKCFSHETVFFSFKILFHDRWWLKIITHQQKRITQKECPDILVHTRVSQHTWFYMLSELMCIQISHFIQPSISTNNSITILFWLSWPQGLPKNNLETHQWLEIWKKSQARVLTASVLW